MSNETPTVIDWEAVYEDATAEEIQAATTEQKVEELAVELAAVAIDFLDSDAEYTLDLDGIKDGIRAARG